MNSLYSLTLDVATFSAAQKCRIVNVGWTGEYVDWRTCAQAIGRAGGGGDEKRKTCQISRSLYLGLNPKPPTYKARIQTTQSCNGKAISFCSGAAPLISWWRHRLFWLKLLVVFLGAYPVCRNSTTYLNYPLPLPSKSFPIHYYQSLYHWTVYCLDTDNVVKKPAKRKRFVGDSSNRYTPLMPELSAPKLRSLCWQWDGHQVEGDAIRLDEDCWVLFLY
jgi:hypothetical protein